MTQPLDLNDMVGPYYNPETHDLGGLRLGMGIDTYLSLFGVRERDFPCVDTPCSLDIMCDYGYVTLSIDDRVDDSITFQHGAGRG